MAGVARALRDEGRGVVAARWKGRADAGEDDCVARVARAGSSRFWSSIAAGTTTDAARSIGQYMPLAELAQRIYEEVVKNGGQAKDFSYVYECGQGVQQCGVGYEHGGGG